MSKIAISLCLLSLFGTLQAEKIVQCITNFPIDAQMYTQFLKEHGSDAKVVAVNIKDYEEDLLIRKGRFHAFLRKFNLDYPSRATVPPDVEKIVFFNLNPSVTKKYALSRLPKDKLVLFMWEPKTVLNNMYQPDVLACFSKVYTWDDSLVDGKTFFKFHYPVLVPMMDPVPSFEEKKLCTLISSNLKSSVENELYSERERAIRYFEEVSEEGFEFYGRRWDPSQFKSYKGEVEDKFGTMKNYRFAICYENTRGTPGYVTEKIFDCFGASVVPIYWGASNVEEFIPKECFIDRRDFDSMEELHLFLRRMPKATYEKYIAHIRAFLQSDAANKFTYQDLSHTFYQSISD